MSYLSFDPLYEDPAIEAGQDRKLNLPEFSDSEDQYDTIDTRSRRTTTWAWGVYGTDRMNPTFTTVSGQRVELSN